MTFPFCDHIANKIDAHTYYQHRAISTETGQELADKYGFAFIEISAQTGENVNTAFEQLISASLCAVATNKQLVDQHLDVDAEEKDKKDKKCNIM